MDIYSQALDFLSKHPAAQRWPRLAAGFERARQQKPMSWQLPVIACEAVGGKPEGALRPVAAISCAHIAILLIDDMLDKDPRGEHHNIGEAHAANLAIGLTALAADILAADETLDQPELAVQQLSGMMHILAYGQDMDAQNIGSEESYWQIAQAKSSSYFAASFFIGALYGGASVHLAGQLKRFGEIYGEIMQIHDDLNDTLATPANPDWLEGRFPLPVLFAHVVDHPDRERFEQLRGRAEDPDALEEAQEILVRCGAISYCVDALSGRHQKAVALLNEIPLPKREQLDKLLGEVIEPVNRLFAAVAASTS